MTFALSAPRLTEAGFRHGFSLRTGGVSLAPFTSLNLARNLGDRPDFVEENQRRLASAIGYEPSRLFEVSQVHGAQVEHVDDSLSPEAFRAREADALLTNVAGVAVGIRVADCVPILLADRQSGAVAAVHAGWKGIVSGVVGRAVSELLRVSGGKTQDVLCAVGPHIGAEAFEVGHEVAEALSQCVPQVSVVLPREPRPHVDLGRAVGAQLQATGISPHQIELVGGCTYSDAARYYSYRRDGSATGRHLAVILARC